jgi:uncharacterized protein (DUF983 family)
MQKNASFIDSSEQLRSWKPAIVNGMCCRCPACGQGKLFTSYLKVAEKCSSCGTDLHHHRADDAPAYITIVLVGHIIVPLLLAVEKLWHPSLLIHGLIWTPLTVLLTLWLLPITKGAVVGLQWAFRMHGFGGDSENHQT